MSQDTLAIGLFLLGVGFTLALAAFTLGLTLFTNSQNSPQSINQRRPIFWLDKLIALQKPEYRRFSYGLYAFALLLMLSGSGWMLYH